MHYFQWDCHTNSYREATSTVERMHQVQHKARRERAEGVLL